MESLFRNQTILIVENDIKDAVALQKTAQRLGLKVNICKNQSEFDSWLLTNASIDFAVIDIYLTSTPVREGFKVIADLKEKYPDCPIVAVSSDPTLADNIEVIKAGAALFARKPIDIANVLEVSLTSAKYILDLKYGRILEGRNSKKPVLPKKFKYSYLGDLLEKYPLGIVVEPEVVSFIERILKKVPNCPFLILGPTGSGKEQIARLILTKKQELLGPTVFESQNCALFNSDTGSSALFGHKRGAFTGADKDRKGAIGNAHKGILFLDEVHTLSIGFQEKLLRFLQDKSYQQLGSDEWLKADVQLIFASNENFEALVAAEKFKPDLYYRIASGEIIKLRGLSGAPDLIRDTVGLFFASKGIDISEASFEKIVRQCLTLPWHGQFRELAHALERLERHVEGNNYDDAKIQSHSIDVKKFSKEGLGLVNWITEKLEKNPTPKLLTEAKCDLVEYFKNEGYNYEQIADVLGVTKNTVTTIAKEAQGREKR